MQNQLLHDNLQSKLGAEIIDLSLLHDEVTIEVAAEHLHHVCKQLRDVDVFRFEQLIDVCGLDYLDYGKSEWVTAKASSKGFERAALRTQKLNVLKRQGPRFAVVYHLLSLQHNQRLRVKVLLKQEPLIVPSVTDIWPAANWFEREAYDFFGILFEGHPDLRRILTDYGFNGHPFRKDFPLSGYVEMRYDATEQRVIYEKVDIEPRVLVPKVIRQDSRYSNPEVEQGDK